MKKTLLLSLCLVAIGATAQTTTNLLGPLSTLESYVTVNDTNYNGWTNNTFTLWQGAAFSSVQGVPGASSIGNDLGLDVPIWRNLGAAKLTLGLESVTRFETVFGDVSAQQFGLEASYDLHQVRLAAGLAARYWFNGSEVSAVPYLDFKKASTSLYGLAPGVRYSYPITKKPNAGEIEATLSISF